MIDRIINPTCTFNCEALIGPDASLEAQEVIKIYDESLELKQDGKYQEISIANFKNTSGQTIGEFLCDNHNDFAHVLAKE